MKTFVALLSITLLCSACGTKQTEELPPITNKAPVATGPTGRIRGFVHFEGNPPAAAFDAITENQSTCGDKVSLSRLLLGKDKGVQHAFVYLDGVKSTDSFRPQGPVLVDQKNCQYAPHTLVVPVGAKLDITNSDPILHNVHGQQVTDQGPQTLFNIAQPVRGQRTTIDSALTTPGVVFLTCEAGHPWMSGYVFVSNHPFVALTNEAGEFTIEGAPVGTYRIKMWHEGIMLKRNIKSLQRYEYEEPYELAQDVIVQASSETLVHFTLTLRPRT